MAFELPPIPFSDFVSQLAVLSPEPLLDTTTVALFAHYEALRRWNRSLALIGPGTAAEILSRHYGESLAALALIPEKGGEGLDLGSGAGFPGFPLAAARRGLRITLVEARQKKARFLLAAARAAALPLRCLDVKVSPPLPAGLPDSPVVLTVRALKLSPALLREFSERMAPEGQILIWTGSQTPTPAPGWAVGRQISLAGSDRRRIVELIRAT